MKVSIIKPLAILLLFLFTCTAKAQTIPTPDHVVIVMMENHGTDLIVGSANAPYINGLIADTMGAFFSQSYAVTHPSQPNYISLYSGSTQSVLGDITPFSFQLPFTAPNLGAQLLQSGHTFAGYAEDMPQAGFTSDTHNNYVRRHCPWINWQDGATNGIPAALSMPYTNFPSHYDSLPTLCFVIPNLQDDMHDGSVAQGDTWLRNNIDAYVQWARSHNSLLIVTWDEDENIIGSSTTIPTIFVGQMVKAGAYTEHIDHNYVLRTIEAMYSLPFIADAATATTISDCWVYKPHSIFSATPLDICVGGSVALTNASTNTPIAWQWYFAGGTPSVSYSQTPPVVNYTTAGNYDVKLITANHMGFDTLTLPGYIKVHSYPSLAFQSDSLLVCTADTITVTASGAGNYTWLPGAGIISTQGNTLKAHPLNNVTYAVTGDNAGCAGDTAQIAVTVTSHVTPDIQIAPDAVAEVCQGSSIVLNASVVNEGNYPIYQWKVNGNNVGANAPVFSAFAFGTDFTVSCNLTSSASCALPASTHSGVTSVHVHSIPVVNWIGLSDTSYVSGTPVILNGTSPTGGTFSGDGVWNGTFYPDSAGEGSHVVTYIYSDSIGCGASTSKTFVVLTTGINETSIESAIQCFPNPASDILVISSALFSDKKIIPVIYDAQGRAIKLDYENRPDGFVFNTASLSPGIYLVKVNMNGEVVTKRFEKIYK